MARIKIRSAKNKGMRLQKWVCEQIARIAGIAFDNQDDACEIHSRECGLSGVDVILRGGASKLFPFSVECKSTEKWSVMQAVEQAKTNTRQGTDWLLVMKKNHSEPVVVLDAKVFFDIYEKVIDGSE